MLVRLKAKPNASQRTNNRIREHGPEFVKLNVISSLQDNCSLFRVPNTPTNDPKWWAGWLPNDEIEIEEISL